MKSDNIDANVEVLCHDCTASKYPLKGKFSEETVRKAKGAKFHWDDPLGEFGGENLWVKIEKVKDGKVYGILNNHPVVLEYLKHGQRIVAPISEVMELEFE